MSRLTASLIVFIGAAGYGVLATFVKIGYEKGFHVGEITGSQMFAGAVILWIIALFKVRSWRGLSWKNMMLLMGVGTFTGLTGVFYYTSMQTLPASIAIILLFQFTWIGVLYEWLFDRRKPTKETYYSLVLVLLGTMLAANVISGDLSVFTWFGLSMGLCSAFTYAAFIYVSGKVATNISPWLRSPLMITGSSLAIFLIFPPTFFTSGVLWEGLWYIALIMAFFGAILPTICFTIGVPYIGSGLAAIIGSVELPVAVFMAWIVLSEAVSPVQWVGVVMILAAIVLGELKNLQAIQRKKKRLSSI
ncbi:drug/metabolite transporter (DMT)-like permease [Caldalkalibacillus uzonensis]|uniref:Drug/metabolite transporter (DMT)-like permease n=1 Tax=Caldalkalibacillus uzonensis TaxID=353224 RepID=A0ABU0CVI2_9BACI|nr:DMT family transporter [Caldalkalibacillus uzonensis]MDQ0340334.1 drug/metabolite transporter (DMT)-like permease [Caldalkalibacillus uzonensis]